jgi:hypothetical protein
MRPGCSASERTAFEALPNAVKVVRTYFRKSQTESAPRPRSEIHVAQGLDAASAAGSVKGRERDRLREALVAALIDGKLIALGIPDLLSGRTSHRIIPSDAFELETPKWHQEKISAFGTTYNRVRISEPFSTDQIKSRKSRRDLAPKTK